ncbi:MAG: glycosyltransferase family 39 protein [Pseudomonadota bacterium]|nr:glycosyltransferase family 39 protein [Pseudomonadota bacterium]
MSAPRSSSGDQWPLGRRIPASLIAVVAAVLAIRIVVGGSVHLTEDEAYYRLWSMAPALGYYDHPPMIAWWIWLGRHVASDTPLGARLMPILASATISFLVFDLARLGGADRQTASRAGIWYNAMVLVLAGGFLAVPDAPAALFWTSTLWCALRAERAASTSWWLAAGAMAGLAVLSKYSALFLAPGIFLWLAWTPRGRAELGRPGPWLALAVASLLFSLNLAWNASHHWLTFAKQFGRIAPSHLAPRYLGEFLLTQALLLNPLIAGFLVRALATRGKPDRLGATIWPFVATTAPFVAYLAFHSLHDRVQAHWPAPVYPALAIIAAVGADGLAGSPAWTRLRAAAPIFGFGSCAALIVYLALLAGVGGLIDLARPVRGWPAFAGRLEALRGERGAAWIGTESYGLAAELADEAAIGAPVLQIAERERYLGLGPAPPPDLSRPGLLVDLPRRIDLRALRQCFGRVDPIGKIARGAPGEVGTPYLVIEVSAPRRDILRAGC